jgi:hypothetical protein
MKKKGYFGVFLEFSINLPTHKIMKKNSFFGGGEEYFIGKKRNIKKEQNLINYKNRLTPLLISKNLFLR